MNALLMLIPLAVILLLFAVAGLVWAVRRGQFDDLDTPALEPLSEDDGLQTEAPAGREARRDRQPWKD